MPFVFDPVRTARVLSALPALAGLIPPSPSEGRDSVAFAGKRITDRALYRLLANPHYPHLRESLRAIDSVAAAGVSLKELRRAEFRGEFGSFLAEVLLADHFLQRGFAVSKGSAGNGRNADLEVVGANLSATVEVYSPRSWQAREDWIQDVVDTLKNADIPFEYAASVKVDTGGIPMTGDLLEDMILRTGRNVLTQIASDLATLDETIAGTTWTYQHQSVEMTTSIEFGHVARNSSGLVRSVGTSPPGEVLWADEVFEEVLAKIREKAERRQAARGSGELKGLAVDMSRTGIDFQLESGRLTLDPSTAGLDLDELGLDFLALCLPRRGKSGPKRGVRASTIYEDTRITKRQIDLLFGA